jgi:hypothetical protein
MSDLICNLNRLRRRILDFFPAEDSRYRSAPDDQSEIGHEAVSVAAC